MLNRFPDRAAAGRAMGTLLADYRGQDDVVVLGLARGGMPLAFEVACALNTPLDVLVTCKLSAPGAPEFALGAISCQGITVINEEAMQLLVNSRELSSNIQREQAELRHREAFYRRNRPPAPIKGKTVILVDDGAVTGATMRAAIRAVRDLGVKRVVAALPVASLPACALLHAEADELVCEVQPAFLQSVGEWYRDFSQVTDGEVRDLLARADDSAEHPLRRQNAAVCSRRRSTD
jgi:putative phosphoribosyl transferase